MYKACIFCSSDIKNTKKQFITNGLCLSCTNSLLASPDKIQSFLNRLKIPVLFMQNNPRQAVTANQKACSLFSKNMARIKDHRGGQVFDCIHSFTEKGCGMDSNCDDCKIKNAVVETFTSGTSFNDVKTILDIKHRNEGTNPYAVHISTEKIGPFALIAINTYEKIDA